MYGKNFVENVLAANQEEEILEQELNEEEMISQMLKWLMPWLEKTDEENTLGYWQDTLPTTMMVMLLNLWLTEKNQKSLAFFMKWYHPLDRAALAYALLVYAMTGHRMTLKNKAAQRHYELFILAIDQDMTKLYFADHLRDIFNKSENNDQE